MISLSGLLLGVINILIVVVVLLLIGAIIELVMRYLSWTVDWTIRRLYLAFVALVALYLLVRLLLGVPMHLFIE